MRHRLAIPAALAVLVLGLASCTGSTGSGLITEAPSYPNQGSDDGGESPQESDGGGEGEGDEQAAPDIPAPDTADYPGIDENTPEGAEQFMRYYFDTVFWGFQTGDASRMHGLSLERCEACNDYIASVEYMGDNGVSWGDVDYELQHVTLFDSVNYDHEFEFILVIGEHEEPDPDAGTTVEVGAQSFAVIVGTQWESGEWVVTGISIHETESDDG